MKPPKYRHFKPRNLGFVEFRGKRHYFPGKHGSPESIAEYGEFVRRNVIEEPLVAPPTREERAGLIFADLVNRWLDWAETGLRGSREFEIYRRVLLLSTERYGETPLHEFGPLRLLEFQRWLAETEHVREYRGKGGQVTRERRYRLTRGTVNHLIGNLRRVFKWGVSRELVAPDQLAGLMSVGGVRQSSAVVADPAPRRPVSWSTIESTLPHLPAAVQSMVLIQWFTGCRPQDVCQLRPCEIDRSVSPWVWSPSSHKNAHRGQSLTIFLGAKSQSVLLSLIDAAADPTQFLFRPAGGKRERYQADTYGKAVLYGLAKLAPVRIRQPFSRAKFSAAGLEYWTPHQIRHARATEIRAKHGIEASQAALGHASIDATQIYAKRNLDLARQIAQADG